MPLSNSFSISQNPALPNILSFTDTSIGSDNTITSRRIYLQKADGTYLVPAGSALTYISWAYSVAGVDVNVMDKDYALSVRVDWLDANNTAIYTKTTVYVFTAYSEMYYYGLGKGQIANPALVSDKNYYNNKIKLRVSIDDAVQAVSFALDIVKAQLSLDAATNLVINKIYYF